MDFFFQPNGFFNCPSPLIRVACVADVRKWRERQDAVEGEGLGERKNLPRTFPSSSCRLPLNPFPFPLTFATQVI